MIFNSFKCDKCKKVEEDKICEATSFFELQTYFRFLPKEFESETGDILENKGTFHLCNICMEKFGVFMGSVSDDTP